MTSVGVRQRCGVSGSTTDVRGGCTSYVILAEVYCVDVFQTIKRLVLRRMVLFTAKADEELAQQGLEKEEVYEAVLNAPGITKRLRSRDPESGKREYLYVIKGNTFDGTIIYTKGKIKRFADQEVFYVFIASKRSTD